MARHDEFDTELATTIDRAMADQERAREVAALAQLTVDESRRDPIGFNR